MTDMKKQGRANRRKGSQTERDVTNYLGDGWIKASRSGHTGTDVTNGTYAAEVKNYKGGAGRVATVLAQAEEQSKNGQVPVAIVKTPNKNIGEATVTMRLKDWAKLIGSDKSNSPVQEDGTRPSWTVANLIIIDYGDHIFIIPDIGMGNVEPAVTGNAQGLQVHLIDKLPF